MPSSGRAEPAGQVCDHELAMRQALSSGTCSLVEKASGTEVTAGTWKVSKNSACA
jgi:hypothetical protein